MTEQIQKWYAGLSEDEQIDFDERAAIIEYHGEKPRELAEQLAYQRFTEHREDAS